MKYWRSHCIPVVVYLDDGWVCSHYNSCIETASFLRKTLECSGFQVNIEKSQFVPVDKIICLGFLWNLRDGILEVPNEKIEKIRKNVELVVADIERVSARDVASFVGKVISLKPGLGSICQQMTRCLSMALCKRTGWDSVLNLSRDCVKELVFWNKNFGNLPSSKITWFNKTQSKILFSDASEFAGAGYSIEQDTKIVHYMWSDWEKSKSSTWRELKAICVIIESLCMICRADL